MNNWFTCKTRYEKIAENGMCKTVTESYLVEALSFTEAENKIIEEMTSFINGEFSVSSVTRANYRELFYAKDESDYRWFKCKLWFVTLDEKSGAEKKTAVNVLVQASDLHGALERLDKNMEGTMADYRIASIVENAIIDIYSYEAGPNV